MNFDYMAGVAAVIYTMGIYLHYVHVKTIFYLLEREDEMNDTRTMMRSSIWPWTVLMFIVSDLTDIGEDEDD